MLRAECQSARMSKITNDGLTRSGTKAWHEVKFRVNVAGVTSGRHNPKSNDRLEERGKNTGIYQKMPKIFCWLCPMQKQNTVESTVKFISENFTNVSRWSIPRVPVAYSFIYFVGCLYAVCSKVKLHVVDRPYGKWSWRTDNLISIWYLKVRNQGHMWCKVVGGKIWVVIVAGAKRKEIHRLICWYICSALLVGIFPGFYWPASDKITGVLTYCARRCVATSEARRATSVKIALVRHHLMVWRHYFPWPSPLYIYHQVLTCILSCWRRRSFGVFTVINKSIINSTFPPHFYPR